MKKSSLALVLILLCGVIAIFPLIHIKDSEFGGADGAAEEMITQINPDYEPWFKNLIEPPGTETESLMFALQASLGTAVIAFGFGYLVARKKYSKDHDDAESTQVQKDVK